MRGQNAEFTARRPPERVWLRILDGRWRSMPEVNRNLWAPWRMEYIHSLGPDAEDEGCFLCRYWEDPSGDLENRVVWRGRHTFVLMNKWPYTNGHLLIAPAEHVPDLSALDDASLLELTRATRDAVRVVAESVHAHGFNVGFNLGQCAGAGLPGHVHTHVVPRWNGDTSYVTTIGDARVIPQSLDELHELLKSNAAKLGIGP